MPKTLFLTPKPGVIVRDPVTKRPLAADGETKADSTYWRRRLRDGDVTASTAPKGGKK